jgi:hypothetical protein
MAHVNDLAQRAEPRPILLAPGIILDAPAAPGWRSLLTCPLLVIVGLTGVGKSSALQQLTAGPAPMTMLPDRRQLTEQLIVAPLQQGANQEQHAVGRLDRFPYVLRFLEQHPGGMAEIVQRMSVATGLDASFLIFDGLRGPHEVGHAITHFPLARFAEFTAPAMVRVERLLARNDPHDQLTDARYAGFKGGDLTFAALGVPDAAALFTPSEETSLCAQAAANPGHARALQRILEIMVAEHALYAPEATHTLLASLEPRRVACIDTSRNTAEEAARICGALCRAAGHGERPDG